MAGVAELSGPPLLHVDVDAFFASVEQRDDPALLGRPMAVAVGIVACASYEARAFGVRSGTLVRTALTHCPELITVPPRHQAYREASRQLFVVLDDVARTVESGSMEEAFLDVAGLDWAGAEAAARDLARRVLDEVGLPVSVGVGRTKMIAKLASRTAKPAGVRVIDPVEEATLRPGLTLAELWGVGSRTVERLAGERISTVHELRRYDEERLCELAGTAMGRRLYAIAHGMDDATVRTHGPRQSVSAQSTLRRGTPRDHEIAVLRLADRITRRLAASGLGCGRLHLTDLAETRRYALDLPRGCDDPIELTSTALDLLALFLDHGPPVRGLRLSATRLGPASGVTDPGGGPSAIAIW